MHRFVPALFCVLFLRMFTLHAVGDFPVLVEDAPDNSAGFAVFERAGLVPVPENARPARFIHDLENASGPFRFSMNHHQQYAGWFWEEDGEIRLLRGNRMWEGPVRLSGRMIRRTEEREGAVSVQPADILQDTRRLFERWISHRERGFSSRISAVETGNNMLLAVRLHQTGHSGPANQLAAHLFETAGRRETLLAALSAIQDLNYNDLFQEFLRHQDLETFTDAVEAMVGQHRDTWLSAGIAEEAVQAWREALAHPPEAPGDLDEVQSRLYTQLAGMTEPRLNQILANEGNWLLRPARQMIETLQMSDELTPTARGIIHDIWQLGAETLPVIIALTENNRVIPLDRSQFHQSWSFSGTREERELYELRRAFPRPAQVADFAERLLQVINPVEFDELTGDELRDAARDLYQDLKGKSRLEIAVHFYETRGGLDELDPEILFTLLARGGPEYLQRFREHVENLVLTGHLHEMSELVPVSPLYRGEDGAAFRDRIVAALRERFTSELENQESWEGQTVRNLIDRITKTDETAAEGDTESPESFDALIDSILAGNNDMEPDLTSMQNLYQDIPGLQKTFLNRHGDIKNDLQRQMVSQIFFFLMQMSRNPDMLAIFSYGEEDNFEYYENPEPGGGGPAPESGEPDTKASLLVADLWRPHLEQPDTALAYELATLVLMMESPDQETLMMLASFLSEEDPEDNPLIAEMVISRALSILDGEAPDWDNILPDSRNVPAERAEAMEAILHGEDVEAVLTLLHTRDWNEIAWIEERLERPAIRGNQVLQQALADPRRTVISLKSEDMPDLGEHAPAPGDRITEAHVLAILTRLQQHAREGQSGFLLLQESGIKPGLQLLHSPPYPGMNESGPSIQVIIFGSGMQAHRTFTLDEEIDLHAKPDTEELSEEMAMMMGGMDLSGQEPIAKELNNWLTATDIPHGQQSLLMILYTGTPAPETPEP